MRIVGDQDRSEIELDPVKAYRRGRALDAMLRTALPPVARGVTRGSHQYFNRIDAERQRQVARTLNVVGDKKPSGPALKLLDLVERKGLDVLDTAPKRRG